MTMAECLEKLNITIWKNTKRPYFPFHHFSFLLLFTTFGEWGKLSAELIDELVVAGADDDCPLDSLDLCPVLILSIAVSIQGGNIRMHHEMLMKIAPFTINEQSLTLITKRKYSSYESD